MTSSAFADPRSSAWGRSAFDALEWSLRARAGHPFVTFYDQPRGERTELSTTSFANAVTKAANALSDSGAETCEVELPLHWQSLVWLYAGLVAGCEVRYQPEQGRLGPGHGAATSATPRAASDVLIVGPEHLDSASHADAELVLATSLHPWGMPFTHRLPPGIEDATLVTRVQPDALVFPAAAGTLRLGASEAINWPAMCEEAAAGAESRSIGPGSRVLFDGAVPDRATLSGLLCLPVLCDGGLVLSARPLTGREVLEAERVTATW